VLRGNLALDGALPKVAGLKRASWFGPRWVSNCRPTPAARLLKRQEPTHQRLSRELGCRREADGGMTCVVTSTRACFGRPPGSRSSRVPRGWRGSGWPPAPATTTLVTSRDRIPRYPTGRPGVRRRRRHAFDVAELAHRLLEVIGDRHWRPRACRWRAHRSEIGPSGCPWAASEASSPSAVIPPRRLRRSIIRSPRRHAAARFAGS
jgi:hypothetical protein